jgi:hypothetical protein
MSQRINCSADQVCGTNTIAKRSSFQLLPDASWVKKVLIGTGNCSTEVDFIDSLILVVESYGALIVDLEDDSLPLTFQPSPQPQTTAPEPEPTPLTVPVPQPETNPVPAVNPSPDSSNPLPPEISPAELNPSPFIITPVSEPNNLNPVPGVFINPAPMINPEPMMNPEPLPQPPASGNFSVWLHVYSVSLKFQVTLIDDDENIPYTESQRGPCMPAIAYWGDKTLGCPCNGNWIGGGSYNQSMTMGGREIVPNDCPDASCPENFYINDTLLYGNVRLNVSVYENGTIMNKTLEMTKLSATKEIGYAFGVADIMYVYGMGSANDQTNTQPSPDQEQPPEQSPGEIDVPEREENPAPFMLDDSNSGTPLHLATTITMIFVFLLMMYEYTQ